MSRTYRDRGRAAPLWSRGEERTFRCRHCRRLVGEIPSGGKHRNHCPFCLYSRHVDGARPGDRSSECGGSMAPEGAFTRPNGEYVLVHRCLACGFARYNRIAADDDFDLVQALPLFDLPQRRTAPPEGRPLTA